jgi:hypothetical protein
MHDVKFACYFAGALPFANGIARWLSDGSGGKFAVRSKRAFSRRVRLDERGGVGIRLEPAAAIVRQYGGQFRRATRRRQRTPKPPPAAAAGTNGCQRLRIADSGVVLRGIGVAVEADQQIGRAARSDAPENMGVIVGERVAENDDGIAGGAAARFEAPQGFVEIAVVQDALELAIAGALGRKGNIGDQPRARDSVSQP